MKNRHLVLPSLFLLCFLMSCQTGAHRQQPAEGSPPQPPVARIDNVVDEYFGVAVDDPYRYMEDIDDPEVQEWIKGQADYAANFLTRLPGRAELLERLQELDAGNPYRTYGYRMLADGTLFYEKRNAGENLYKLYVRTEAGDRLLVDPEQVPAEEGEHFSLEVYSPSADGRYVVYGLAKSGSEETVLHILEVESGQNIPETIDRIETAYNRPHWLPDGSGFFYSRRRQLSVDAPETEIYKKTKIYFHQLNSAAESDRLIAGIGLSERMPLGEVDFPSMYLPPGSQHAIVKVKHGDANELTLYTAPVSSLLTEDIPWKKVCDVEHEVVDYAVHADDIFLQSAQGASRFKIVRTSLETPDMATAEVILPETDHVIDYVTASADALYIVVTDGGFMRIFRREFGKGGSITPLELPGQASAWVTAASPGVEGVLVGTSSWTRGGAVYAFDPDENAFAETDLLPKGEFDDLPGYESIEVKAESHDGVMVPLSIIYKSGIELNGENPALIRGYGAYGYTNYVYFNPLRIAWLERGGIIAVAHVRGGGEYGKAWHLAGQKLTKPHTWKDFIACAEYLIEQGYTSTPLLAGQGGSAGGITVGRAITERPDLFAAAIINVGDLDAVRMETTTNGVPNIPEFGTVTEEDGFKGLLAMSSYHHVKEGTEYPAVLMTHGMNDPRVEPWNSAKMTARLQAASASGKPILFRADYSAGHGIGSTRMQYLEETADEWAFLLSQLGMDAP